MAFVSITRLRVRRFWFMPGFFQLAARSLQQAAAAPGNIHVRVLRDVKLTFWTATSWTSEAAMRAFLIGGAHGKAMHKLLDWCDEASIAHWIQEEATLPDWHALHQRMLRGGRLSKVTHPSPAQLAFAVPLPVTTGGRSTVFR
jgi:heme-degrading monooxygenase HmoA